MKKSHVLAAVAMAALLILPAAPANASSTESHTKGCKATLLVGQTLYTEAQPTSSHSILGESLEKTRVRVVEDPAGPAVKIEAFHPQNGIFVHWYLTGADYYVPTGYVALQSLKQTPRLEHCLAKRFSSESARRAGDTAVGGFSVDAAAGFEPAINGL